MFFVLAQYKKIEKKIFKKGLLAEGQGEIWKIEKALDKINESF